MIGRGKKRWPRGSVQGSIEHLASSVVTKLEALCDITKGLFPKLCVLAHAFFKVQQAKVRKDGFFSFLGHIENIFLHNMGPLNIFSMIILLLHADFPKAACRFKGGGLISVDQIILCNLGCIKSATVEI